MKTPRFVVFDGLLGGVTDSSNNWRIRDMLSGLAITKWLPKNRAVELCANLNSANDNEEVGIGH